MQGSARVFHLPGAPFDMDEINYKRITTLAKQRCEDCGATEYLDPTEVFRCVVCDHERFETCLDCGFLVGWCECAPAAEAAPKNARGGAAK